MWGNLRRIARTAIPVAVAGLVSACGALPFPSASPEAVELTTGPALVWLTSSPVSPLSPVDVMMTASDPGIRFAHTFDAGVPLRGDFATSRGSYVLSALGGACRLPLKLGAGEEAQVVLALAADGTCSLSVSWQGSQGAEGRPMHGDGVLVTNRDAGGETP